MRHRLTSCLLFMLQSQWSRLFDTFRHTQFNFIAPWPHFLSPPPHRTLQPGHPFTRSWMNPAMSACIKSAVEVRQLRGRSALVLDWPGLAWAGQSIIANALASYLASPSIFASLLCCECSFLLVRSSEACQFPLKCFGVFCRAFSGFVLHVHFNLLHVSYAFYGIQWRHSNRRQCFYNRQGPQYPCIATIMSRDVMERTNCKNSQDGAVYSI